MPRQRNNIYAVAADAVDLALDTAGTIGSVVEGVAHMVGIGKSEPAKSEKTERREADDAATRVAKSLRQEAKAAAPRVHKAKAAVKRVAKKRPVQKAKSVKKAAKRGAA